MNLNKTKQKWKLINIVWKILDPEIRCLFDDDFGNFICLLFSFHFIIIQSSTILFYLLNYIPTTICWIYWFFIDKILIIVIVIISDSSHGIIIDFIHIQTIQTQIQWSNDDDDDHHHHSNTMGYKSCIEIFSFLWLEFS